MMSILHSIELPEDTDIDRQYRKKISPELEDDYKAGHFGSYDHRTIFYDIFFIPESGELVALGPPLLNLEKVLLPIQLWINHKKHTLRKNITYKEMVVFTAKTGYQSGPLNIKVEFNNGLFYTLSLDNKSSFLSSGRALFTIQKDNDPRWIKDWIDYYKETWSIDHVFIYDNNSSNQQQLINTFNNEKVTVVPWNYPYGIYRMTGNSYCQIGALNHFKQRFGKHCKIFNFDIDELLVCKDPSLQERINKENLLRFDSYMVPHDTSLRDNYSFVDYIKRETMPRNGAYKYIVNGNTADILNVHKTEPRGKVRNLLKKALPKKYRHASVEPVENAYFLHYMGITTNWKSGADEESIRTSGMESVNDARYTTDLSVKESFNSMLSDS
jgi:hypothetical protein